MVRIIEQPKPFDPFTLIPVFRESTRRMHTGWLVIPWLAVFVLVVVTTAMEGTLGTLADVRWFTDVRNVFGQNVSETPPQAPLLRDAPDIALFAIMVAGALLLHRQWQYIAACIPRLRATGTIIARQQPRLNGVTRILGLNRLIGINEDYRALDVLEGRLGRVGRVTKVFLITFVLVAGLALAILLHAALDENALRVYVPTGISTPEQQQWLIEARNSWWAGSTHPFGNLLYAVLTWVGMSLIVAYNVMGLITAYVALAVSRVSDTVTDWYNRDGRYGWLPVTEIYRSVYWSIVLFVAAMVILVSLPGSKTPIALIGLASRYMLLIPVYTFIPWLVFRRVERHARTRRQEELSQLLVGTDQTDIDKVQLFVAEFARCRTARIRPMSIGGLRFSGFASVVLLPIVLTLLQVFLPLGFGR